MCSPMNVNMHGRQGSLRIACVLSSLRCWLAVEPHRSRLALHNFQGNVEANILCLSCTSAPTSTDRNRFARQSAPRFLTCWQFCGPWRSADTCRTADSGMGPSIKFDLSSASYSRGELDAADLQQTTVEAVSRNGTPVTASTLGHWPLTRESIQRVHRHGKSYIHHWL